jgi:hypothetical protein
VFLILLTIFAYFTMQRSVSAAHNQPESPAREKVVCRASLSLVEALRSFADHRGFIQVGSVLGFSPGSHISSS